ncbi:MAG: ATP phosphoribosyltransferase regulatory subunit [Candidatus Pacearchaeota archaeon]
MESVKGFKDYTGEEATKRAEIMKILMDVFERYNFEPAETPVVEYEEFVKGENSSDEAVSDIFKLEDKGSRKLALRYEFTFQLKRIAKGKKLPYKRYQIGPVFRDEPVTGNRFRQFIQCDIDTIGSTVKDEAEVLAVVNEIFKKIGIKTIININSRKLLNEILEKEKMPEKNKNQILREIDKLDKLPENEVKNNLKKLKAEKILDILRNKEAFFEKYESYSEIKKLKKYCRYYNIKVNFQPSLVRGLSYYTKTVFEVKTEKIKETICGGGTYLIEGIESTGISFGLDRIEPLANLKQKKQTCLIVSINQDEKAISLSNWLRKDNIPCTIFYNKVSKALEFANSKKIPYAVIIGEKEVKSKKYTLRDMKTGKEEKIVERKLVNKLSQCKGIAY